MKRREFVTLLGAAAAAWPLSARAQPARKIPRIGVLWHAGSAEEEGSNFKALVKGFTDLGYIEGRMIILEHRFPNEVPDRFRSMAAELVSQTRRLTQKMRPRRFQSFSFWSRTRLEAAWSRAWRVPKAM